MHDRVDTITMPGTWRELTRGPGWTSQQYAENTPSSSATASSPGDQPQDDGGTLPPAGRRPRLRTGDRQDDPGHGRRRVGTQRPAYG